MSFFPIPGRDAASTFAGYIYQVNVTIARWLDLPDGNQLVLEAGEDIDTVVAAANSDGGSKKRLLEQLKQTSSNITLRTPDSLESIANFCRHRESNPGLSITFRFLTTSFVSKERSPWSPAEPGIELWKQIQSGALSGASASVPLLAIKTFLKSCPKPEAVTEESWAALHRTLDDQDENDFKDLVRSFEWVTGAGNHEEVERLVREELQARDPDNSEQRAKIQYRNLFSFVVSLLGQAGDKVLTHAMLLQELTASSMTLADHISAAALRTWIADVDAKLADHESRIEVLERRTSQIAVNTFYEPKRRGPRGVLFDYDQTLYGRRGRLQELKRFIEDDGVRIAVLPGRGGVGKTKLLIDWSTSLTGWRYLWVNPHGQWTDETSKAVPAENTVLIVDDAHQYSDLNHLIAYVATDTGNGPKRKLVIATRPSGQAYVNETLAREADESFIRRFDSLREPNPDAVLEIAREVLGTQFESNAEALSRVSADTPLITVVGGRLIARGQISPDLLVNDLDFRNAVFSKFAADCEGDLPAGGRSRQELLRLMSAVQPVLEQDNNFGNRAAAFLSIRPDQVWQGLDDLEQRGVLVRGRGGLRIAPDLFGDYLLESASVGQSGVSTGFADAVFESFSDTHLSNLLKNFAELDWRITQRTPESRLLDQIWETLYASFRAQGAIERERFLRDIASFSPFQPERVQRIAEIAMDEPVQPERFYSIRKVTQDELLRQVSPLLGVTIYHEAAAQGAFDRLWTLSQANNEGVHNGARRALKEALSYHRYKSVHFNERFLDMVEKKAGDDSAYSGKFTPFDLLNELLACEVDDHGWRKRAFTFTALPVNYTGTAHLRQRVLKIICEKLASSSPRIAVLAAKELGYVIAEFHPKMGRSVTQEELDWQEVERLKALECIHARIGSGNLSPALSFKLRLLLSRIGRRSALSATVKARAASILAELQTPPFGNLLYALCTNPYEDGEIRFNDVSIPGWRQSIEDLAFDELTQAHPRQMDQIHAVERVIRVAVDAGLRLQALDQVFSRLCKDADFLGAFSEHLVTDQKPYLATEGAFALQAWRYSNPSQYQHYGLLFAQSPNVFLARASACTASYGFPVEYAIPEDFDLLRALATRTEDYVLADLMAGLRRFMQHSSYAAEAAQLYADLKIGTEQYLAGHYCHNLGVHPLPKNLFSRDQAERVLSNLVPIEKLERDSIGGLFSQLCSTCPRAIVAFLKQRLQHRAKLDSDGVDSDYKAIPSSFSWSSLRDAKNSPEYRDAIFDFIDLLRIFPEAYHALAPIFWYIADLDGPTLEALDELLHSENEMDTRLLHHLIHESPKGLALSQPFFALHVLSIAESFADEMRRSFRSVLFTNTLRGPGVRTYAGLTPPPADLSHVSQAVALRDQWPIDNPMHTFFAELAQNHAPVLPAPTFHDDEGYEDDILEDDPDPTLPSEV
ncbi:MAG: hypothetical protein PW792_08625 [Acidobacteriaceae bacterium]|nr:hypothetical protein [Acidobacteriaceae bacterium]